MTVSAHCGLCGYPFPGHSPHPVPKPHDMLGTDVPCAGASTVALVGVS